MIQEFNFFAEYLGCFLDNGEKKLFTISPGDYTSDDLSPVSCMTACGRRWHIAGIQNGDLCLCSKTVPTDYVSHTKCDSVCTGAGSYPDKAKPRCGGRLHLSVYNASKRIVGFNIKQVCFFVTANNKTGKFGEKISEKF